MFKMTLTGIVFVLAAILGSKVVRAEVTLHKLSSLYLPYNYSEPPMYDLGTGAAEKFAYHKRTRTAYVVGDNHIHVIDMADPTQTTVATHYKLPEGPGTDIKVCGDHVVASMQAVQETQPGWLIFFEIYNKATKTFDKINQVQVGHGPDMVSHTSDCRTFLSADEGEGGKDLEGNFFDPPGSVTMVQFASTNLSQTPDTQILNFTSFNNRTDELVQKGVRFVYRGTPSSPTTLADDLEPEYIAVSDDDTKAYVCLQENNAIAVVDIANRNITDIFPLGLHNWNNSYMDTSDKDGGINLNSWPIYGIYQPDTIIYKTINGEGYIFGANEGDAKEYTLKNTGVDFSEDTRGTGLASHLSPELEHSSPSLKASLQDLEKLGRLKFSSVDEKDVSGNFTKLLTFGGRSFAIWKASDLSLVTSSGDDIEWRHYQKYAAVFNGNGSPWSKKPTQLFDTRSDDKGPEPESLDAEIVGDKVYVFVGNERTSSFSIYSLNVQQLYQTPTFEGVYRPGGLLQTSNELYQSRNIGDLDPEDLKFIRKEDSPTGKHLLAAVGTVSGTFSLYEVKIAEETPTTASPPPCSSSKLTINLFALFSIIITKSIL